MSEIENLNIGVEAQKETEEAARVAAEEQAQKRVEEKAARVAAEEQA